MKRAFIISSPEVAKRCAGTVLTLTGDDIHQVTIEPYDPKRTLAQNRLLHAWLGAIARSTGHTIEEVKQIAKREILGYQRVEFNGKAFDVLPSTAAMGKKEFTQFVDRVVVWAAENGFSLE